MLLLLSVTAMVLVLLPLILSRKFPEYCAQWDQPIRLVEWKLQNYIHTRATPTPMRGDIVVLGIDDGTLGLTSAFPEDVENSKTLQAMKNGFPFSRSVYADAVTRLMEAGAKAVVLDFIFSTPSQVDPDGDPVLRQAVEKYPGKVILAASFAQTEGVNGMTPTMQTPWDGIIPQSNEWSPNVGFINYWGDDDQVVRWTRFNRSKLNEDAGHPELAHLDQIPSVVTAALHQTGLGRFAPNDDRRHWIRFSSPGAYPPYSLHEIFVPDLWKSNFGDGAFFKDKIVLIGPAAPHMQDYHNTPVGRILGVQLHAQVMAAAINGEFLYYQPSFLQRIAVGGAAFLAWMLVAFWRRPISTAIIQMVLTLAALYLCYWLFEHHNIVVDGVAPLLAFNVAGGLCLTYDFMLERRQRQQLRGYLERYFSPDVVLLMVRDPQHFRSLQEGANRIITIMFSDLRGFTSLSEKLTPTELVAQLNQYFNSMVAVVHNHQGGIDKFIGDAIMAVWGWVGQHPTDATIQQNAIDAVRATLRMREELEVLNRDWVARGLGELKIGVGVHQGEAVVGDLGSSKQSGFTVIGDSVNTGSRLEGTTKEYGVDNIISDVIWNQVKHKFVCRSADLTRVKGKLIPVPLYTVVHEIEKGVPAGMEAFELGVDLYRKGEFVEAQVAFRKASAEGLDDYLTRLYLDRCQALIEHPPTSWDGVFVMTKK